jgi:LacI family transcriptional regulator
VRLAPELEALIREAIDAGRLKPGQKLGSARQLAKEWKTSYGAVRQSLESLAAKGLVERRARAGTFISSDALPAERQGNYKNVIGLLIPDIRIPEYSLVTRCVQDAGHQAGVEVIVSSTDNDRARYDQSIRRHLEVGVGGLILTSPTQSKISLEALLEIEQSGTPVVNYCNAIDVVRWPTVRSNISQAIELLISHLCDIGKKRIGFLTYGSTDGYINMIHDGLYRAMSKVGLNFSNIVEFTLPDTLYLNGWKDNDTLTKSLNSWLDAHPDIDAICSMHDHIAAVMLSVLKERSIDVPEQIAVASCGNMGEFFGLAPGILTTVNTHVDKAAMEMVRILQSPAQYKSDDQPPIVSIDQELVLGTSTVKSGGHAAPKQGA